MKKINTSKGFGRLYFVVSLLWWAFFFSLLSYAPYSYEAGGINIYTDEGLFEIALSLLVVILAPFVFYFVIVFISKIFYWIYSGFRDQATDGYVSKTPKIDGEFFLLLKKWKNQIFAVLLILFGVSLIVNFKFTDYKDFNDAFGAKYISNEGILITPKLKVEIPNINI